MCEPLAGQPLGHTLPRPARYRGVLVASCSDPSGTWLISAAIRAQYFEDEFCEIPPTTYGTILNQEEASLWWEYFFDMLYQGWEFELDSDEEEDESHAKAHGRIGGSGVGGMEWGTPDGTKAQPGGRRPKDSEWWHHVVPTLGTVIMEKYDALDGLDSSMFDRLVS